MFIKQRVAPILPEYLCAYSQLLQLEERSSLSSGPACSLSPRLYSQRSGSALGVCGDRCVVSEALGSEIRVVNGLVTLERLVALYGIAFCGGSLG